MKTEPLHILGIDIGGTKLAVGVSTTDGKLIAHERIPTQSEEGPQRTLARLIEICQRVIKQANVKVNAAGIGCVGPLDQKTGYVINPVNLKGWRQVPLVETIKKGLGIPVFLDNDANAAALGEHRFGAGRGVNNMVYLTISTGIGGGIIANNRLYQGENGNAGELGHVSVNFAGRKCGCGNIGCIETYASGTALAVRAREQILSNPNRKDAQILLQLCNYNSDHITGQMIVEAVQKGDEFASEIWQEALIALGMFMASVIHIFNPRKIVIGGGISNAGDILFDPLRMEIRKHAIPAMASVCEIVKAELGDQVGVLGAVAVGMDGFAGQKA